jgi:hypothetical protein
MAFADTKNGWYNKSQRGVRNERNGEYLTYKYLSRLTPPGYFLFNVYKAKETK